MADRSTADDGGTAIGASIGAMSGLVCYGVTVVSNRMDNTLSVVLFHGLGLVFALASLLFLDVQKLRGRHRLVFEALAVVLIGATWYLALRASVTAYGQIDRVMSGRPLVMSIAMNVGNLIGVFGTFCGLWLATGRAPLVRGWLGALIAGAVVATASALTHFDPANSDVNLLLLLPLWQAAMLGVAGATLPR